MKQLGELQFFSHVVEYSRSLMEKTYFFTIFRRWVHFTYILMAFVRMLHLQASDDAGLSCKPVKPVTRGCHIGLNGQWTVHLL